MEELERKNQKIQERSKKDFEDDQKRIEENKLKLEEAKKIIISPDSSLPPSIRVIPYIINLDFYQRRDKLPLKKSRNFRMGS